MFEQHHGRGRRCPCEADWRNFMPKTYDQLALEVMLDPKLGAGARQRKLSALAKEASDRVNGRVECPECGDKGPHEDNGDRHDLTYCCRACGNHFGEVV
jgi:hypothetical protein